MRSLVVRMVLLAFSIAPAIATQQAGDSLALPTVSFYSLSKDRVTLPADLHSDRNLLLLYFQLGQQAEVDNWNAVIDRWHAADPSLTSYTSLVSLQKNFLSRWWQNASLRSASPNASRWSTTLPLYVDKHAFESALNIPSEQQVILLLMDRQGRVMSRVSGPPTDASRGAMRAALQAAGSPLSTNVPAITKPQP